MSTAPERATVGQLTSGIANKFRRREVYGKLKRERKAEKAKARRLRQRIRAAEEEKDEGSDGGEREEEEEDVERVDDDDSDEYEDGDERDAGKTRSREKTGGEKRKRMEAVTIENSRIRDDDASKVVAAEDMLRDEIVMRCALFVCVCGRPLRASAVRLHAPLCLSHSMYVRMCIQILTHVYCDVHVSVFRMLSTCRTGSGRQPKVLLTTCRKPSAGTFAFISELLHFFPVASFFKRRDYEVRRIARYASNRGFTALIVINEDCRKINGLLHVNLPNGPVAHYKLTNLKLAKDIANHGRPTDHTPEIILNNFSTAMGHRIAHMFASLFCPNPEFRGRRVVTFHNQRDFIFVRHHRYIFNERAKSSDGKKPRRVITRLQELGPRFTLRLLSLHADLVLNPATKAASTSTSFSWKRDTDGRDADKVRRKFAL